MALQFQVETTNELRRWSWMDWLKKRVRRLDQRL
jgi:hypothetical protein